MLLLHFSCIYEKVRDEEDMVVVNCKLNLSQRLDHQPKGHNPFIANLGTLWKSKIFEVRNTQTVIPAFLLCGTLSSMWL